MNERQDFVAALANLSKLTNLDNFYNISLSPTSGQISMQGDFTDDNARFAKQAGVKLEYQETSLMLTGETKDRKLRIVLT